MTALKEEIAEQSKPLLTCRFSDDELGFAGYMVIDSVIGGRCCGGVRLSPAVTLDETICLARNMTLKYAFLGVPLGGAKVGIRSRGPVLSAKRKQVFTKAGESLSPFIVRGSYLPGPDMGTSDDDIDSLLDAATKRPRRRTHAPTARYTSWTVLVSAVEALKELGLKLEDSTVAIEGFGKIGSSAAQAFSERGASVVAISTCEGAIYDPQGLDVARLLQMQTAYADDVVNQYAGAEDMDKNDLLSLPADILLPCAGSWTINASNAHELSVRVVCPGANIPITAAAEQILHDREILSVPDFVSNSGGVLGAFMGSLVSEVGKKEIIERHFSRRVSQLIRRSRARGIPPSKLAQNIATKQFHRIKAEAETVDLKKRLSQLAKDLIPKLYKGMLVRPRAKRMFTRMLRPME